MITIDQLNNAFTVSGKSSLQLHDIVNLLATTPITDPEQLNPVAEISGTNYLTTLQDIEATLAAAGRYIVDKGDTIGLTNDPTFNQRIGRHVSAS